MNAAMEETPVYSNAVYLWEGFLSCDEKDLNILHQHFLLAAWIRVTCIVI